MKHYIKIMLTADNLVTITLLILYSAFSIYMSGFKSVWRDEAFSILVAHQSVVEILDSTSSDFNPPLFYFILHYWQKISSTSIVFIRILPMLFSIFTIVIIKNTLPRVLKLKSRAFSLLLLLFLLSNGSIFYYSMEVRPYSMLMFLSYLVFYYGHKFITENKRSNVYILIIISIALIYTQTLGILWFTLVGTGLAIWLLINKNWHKLSRLLMLWLGVGLSYLPWAYVVLNQVKNVNDSYWLEFLPEENLKNLSALFAFNEGPRHLTDIVYKYIYLILFWLSGLVLAVGLYIKSLTRFISLLIFSTLLILYFLSYKIPLFYGRYFVFLAPLMSSLMAFAVYKLIFNTGQKIPQRIFKLTLGLFILGTYLSTISYLWKDYILGLSRVNYSRIKEINTHKFYVSNQLDIMSCMVYKNSCVYIKEDEELKNYIGFLQLKNPPIMDYWNNIIGDSAGIICRNIECNKGTNILMNKGYRTISNQELGEGVSLILMELITAEPSQNSKEDICESEGGGKWLAEYNECEYINPKSCAQLNPAKDNATKCQSEFCTQRLKGKFSDCESACRHTDINAPINCIAVCVPVCSLN